MLVDARMAKRNLGTTREDARVVVGMGPGFTAGEDVHAVVETARASTRRHRGCKRGLLRDGALVNAGQKIGDVDPRTDAAAIWYISDRNRAVAGGCWRR
ncbi:MAG: hypothetical protein QME87_02135 [Bacillota bacterium]|nr:hypothetical protein [Bacillota bacterium]